MREEREEKGIRNKNWNQNDQEEFRSRGRRTPGPTMASLFAGKKSCGAARIERRIRRRCVVMGPAYMKPEAILVLRGGKTANTDENAFTLPEHARALASLGRVVAHVKVSAPLHGLRSP